MKWKNAIESIDISLDQSEERICEVENIIRNYTVREQIKKKKGKNLKSLHEIWVTIKRNNLYIIGVPEEEREKGTEAYLKK